MFKKKEKLNQQLCRIHLQVAQEWGNVWNTILTSIQDTLNRETEKKCKTIDEKINKLVRAQVKKPNNNTELYLRVVNKTNITFSDEELTLLIKGQKYIIWVIEKNIGRIFTQFIRQQVNIH